jgi:head-tail adaptor
MTGRIVRTAALAACLSLTAPMWAQTSNWLHVEVNEGGEKSSKVNVNLPLSVAKVALGMAPKQFTDKAVEKLNEHDVSIADIRKLWAEIKNAGNAEFVTVQEADETVRVARDGNWVRVRVDKTGDKPERVKVDIPVGVVDALLSGDGESFNLLAAINELEGNTGDIVNVEDGDETVRVWIASQGG